MDRFSNNEKCCFTCKLNRNHYDKNAACDCKLLSNSVKEQDRYCTAYEYQPDPTNVLQVIVRADDDMGERSFAFHIRILDNTPIQKFDITEAVKKAIHEYLCTEEGKRHYDANCGIFGWPDVESVLPNAVCRKYGFEKIDFHTETLKKDWNEQLAQEDLVENFWEPEE